MLCEGKQGYRERKRHDHIDQIVERQRAKQCVSEERRHNRAEPAASRGGDPPQGDDPNRLTGTTIGRGVRSSAIFSFPRDTQASIRAEAENTQRCKPCPASSCASALSPPESGLEPRLPSKAYRKRSYVTGRRRIAAFRNSAEKTTNNGGTSMSRQRPRLEERRMCRSNRGTKGPDRMAPNPQ